MEQSLQEQQELNESLCQAQGDLSAYKTQMEEKLRSREADIGQLKQELERQKLQGHVSCHMTELMMVYKVEEMPILCVIFLQVESSALKVEMERDRHELENALTKAHMLEERDKDNKRLSYQLQQLQVGHVVAVCTNGTVYIDKNIVLRCM